MTYNTIIIACIFAWLFVFILPLIYIGSRWKDKFITLQGYFSDKSLRLYYQLFKPAINIVAADAKIRDLFNRHYHRSYGRRNFILPFLCFSLVSAIAFCVISRTLLCYIDSQSPSSPLPAIAMSSLLGAYLWVALDQVERFRTQDFTFHDINMWTLRLLVSIPVGYAFSYGVKEPVGIPLAFFLGTFPLKSLLKYGRRFAAKHLITGTGNEPDASELENLQGVKRQESERFQDEGIANILQLAYSDPIDLTMRTNFDFTYIVDLKAQALLWIYLENRISELRILSIRSAHEVTVLHQLLESDDRHKREMAKANLHEICERLKVNEDSCRKLLLEVAKDPHTEFVFEIWCPAEFQVCHL